MLGLLVECIRSSEVLEFNAFAFPARQQDMSFALAEAEHLKSPTDIRPISLSIDPSRRRQCSEPRASSSLLSWPWFSSECSFKHIQPIAQRVLRKNTQIPRKTLPVPRNVRTTMTLCRRRKLGKMQLRERNDRVGNE